MTEEQLHEMILNHVATAHDPHRVRQTIEDMQERMMVYLNRIKQGDMQYATIVSLQKCLELYRQDYLKSKLAKVAEETQ